VIKKLNEFAQMMQDLLSQESIPTDMQMESVRTQIGFFQHERLAHELVMLFFALFTVGGILYVAVFPSVAVMLLDVLFMALLIPYISHYFKLENGVQRLYELYGLLEAKRNGKEP